MKKRANVLIFFAICINIFCLVNIYLFNFSSIEIILNGNKNITIGINDEYEELGAKALINKEDVSNQLIIKNDIDNSRPGEYVVEYIVKQGIRSTKRIRKVKVVDNVAPTIELKGNEEIDVYEYDEFRDPGVIVNDNYDKTLDIDIDYSNVDTTKEGSYEVIYKTRDSSNNESVIKRRINVIKHKKDRKDYNRNTKGIPILMYHFFYENDKDYNKYDGWWMSKSKFEAQMKYLSDNDYYFPSWLEIEDYIDGRIDLPDKSVVVTIDDGDRTFIDIAIPILEKYNIKATSFAVGAWTASELSEQFRSKNLSVESHSFDAHYSIDNEAKLTIMSYDEVNDDTKKIKEVLGTSTIYAYPYGRYNDTIINVLKENEYHLGISTIEGRVTPRCNKFTIPRIQVSREISLKNFIKKVS